MEIFNLRPSALKSGTGTSSTNDTVSVTNTVTTALAANSDRVKLTLFNVGAKVAYVKFGVGAATTDYSIEIPSGYALSESEYTGIVTAICAAGETTSLISTEFVI